MDEKTKKQLHKDIIYYVLSVLIAVGLTKSIMTEPYKSQEVFVYIVLITWALLFLRYIVLWLKKLLYEYFSSSQFKKIYRKYKSKHKRQ